MKYIKKQIVGASQQINECWKAKIMTVDLINNKATIILDGYKNKAAFNAKAKKVESRVFSINDITTLNNYLALYNEIVNKILTESNSEWENGVLEDL